MVIHNGNVFNGQHFIKYKNIKIIDDKIVAISNEKMTDGKYIDAKGAYVVPGFIDIHTHGINGYDVNHIETKKKYEECFFNYAKNGTTSLLPSTVAQEEIYTKNLLNYTKSSYCNKSVVGIHLEAPYINEAKLGAQNKDFIRKPSVDDFKSHYSQYYDVIKRVTIAPELDEKFALSKFLYKKNIIPSFGHTISDSQRGQLAFNNGYILATHFMNAMPQIHHREVSITGKALIDDNVFIEIIGDLKHVSSDIIKMVYKIKPRDKVIIISDSMSATLLGDGEYFLSGQKVIVKNNTARLIEGNLAGSLITMLDGVKNFVKIGIDLECALQFATYNPAKILNLEDKIGAIKEGNYADILLLDNKLNIKKVILKGQVI